MIGNLYFIQEGKSGPIKIGWTAGPAEGRRKSGQVFNSRELRIIAELQDYPDSEKTWHQRFAAHHIRGEWFKPAPDLVAAIKHASETWKPQNRMAGLQEAPTVSPSEVWAWAVRKGLSEADFAELLGYTISHLRNFLRDGMSISSPLANRIETVTDGEIRAISVLKHRPMLSNRVPREIYDMAKRKEPTAA
jgi:hypothetical protein